MCFGGGKKKTKTADEFYQEMKKDYGPLPSTQVDAGPERDQQLTDVPKPRKGGMQVRSLLRMNGGG